MRFRFDSSQQWLNIEPNLIFLSELYIPLFNYYVGYQHSINSPSAGYNLDNEVRWLGSYGLSDPNDSYLLLYKTKYD